MTTRPRAADDFATSRVRLENWRCARYRSLTRVAKPANVVTTAIARELTGFRLGHLSGGRGASRLIGKTP